MHSSTHAVPSYGAVCTLGRAWWGAGDAKESRRAVLFSDARARIAVEGDRGAASELAVGAAPLRFFARMHAPQRCTGAIWGAWLPLLQASATSRIPVEGDSEDPLWACGT